MLKGRRRTAEEMSLSERELGLVHSEGGLSQVQETLMNTTKCASGESV